MISDSLKDVLPDALRPLVRNAYWKVQGMARRSKNRRIKRARAPHIHLLRETEHRENGAFLTWLTRRHPDLLRLFRVSAATDRALHSWDGAALFVPWLADPVRERAPALFEQTQALEAAYTARGVPVINRVATLSNAIKSEALSRMREAGVRTARTMHVRADTPFEAVADALGAPFIIRNDRGHGGYIRLIRTPAEFRDIEWDRLPEPLAVEFIDTRGNDGLYRKYRLVFTGDVSLPRHLIITPSWSAHAADRLRDENYLREEHAFLQNGSPYHEPLDRARRALNLDYVAFDFSVMPDGELVVWEPNPYPVIWGPAFESNSAFDYQRPQIEALFAQMLRFYLERANLHDYVPDSDA